MYSYMYYTKCIWYKFTITDLTFGTTNSTQSSAEYTTSLTSTIVDGLKVTIDPDTSGIIIAEIYLEVTYTAATPVHIPYILLNSGKYKITAGKVKIL